MLDHIAAAQEILARYSAAGVLPRAYHRLLQPHLTAIVAAVLADDAELSPGQRAAFDGLAAACHWDLPGWCLIANTPGVKRWPPVNVPPELAYDADRLAQIAVALRGLAGDAPAKPEAEVENPPPKRHRDVTHARRASKPQKPRPLTPRQTEVVQIVGECKGNLAEAARRLGRTYKTVEESYRAGLAKLGKTAVQSRDKTRLLARDRRGQIDVSEDDDCRF
jgi:hypothetical protein